MTESSPKIYEVDKNTVDLFRRALGEQLGAERRIREITQVDIAKAIGVTQRTISQIERGENPVLNHFVGYAEAMGVRFHLLAARAQLVVDSVLSGETPPL